MPRWRFGVRGLVTTFPLGRLVAKQRRVERRGVFEQRTLRRKGTEDFIRGGSGI
jgi:hypothetical protein